MVNKPVAPKTTRSYVRPCCLNPISSRCDMAAEIDQVKYVSSVNIHSAFYVPGYGQPVKRRRQNGIVDQN